MISTSELIVYLTLLRSVTVAKTKIHVRNKGYYLFLFIKRKKQKAKTNHVFLLWQLVSVRSCVAISISKLTNLTEIQS